MGADRPNRRRAALVALAAVAVLAAGLTLGGDDGDEAAAPSSTTRTTRRPRPTTTTTQPAPVGPVLPVQTGASLLLAGSSATWTLLELDTGTRRQVLVGSQDPYNAVPVAGGVVALVGGRAEYVPVLTPDAPSVELGRADQVLDAGRPDRVWLLSADEQSRFAPGQGRARLVDLAGRPLGTDIAVPYAYGYVSGATATGLVFSAGGRVYLAEERGVRPIGVGDVLRTTSTEMVLQGCDDEARCAPVLVDLVTGASRRLVALGDVFNMGQSVHLSADRIATVGYGPGPDDFRPAVTIRVADRAGRILGSAEVSESVGEPTWLPDGLGLLVPTGVGLSRVFERDGRLEVEQLLGIGPRDLADRVLVIRP